MKIPTEVRLCWDFFRGCTCLKCTNRAEMHRLLCWCSRDCCTPWKCTNRAEMHHLLGWCSRDCCTPWKAPTAQKCTIYFVGAAETAAPPGRHQPRKHCTNRANHKRLC